MQTPIILLHGALGTSKTLQPLQEELASDFSVHSLNFRSHGSPSAELFNMSSFTEQVGRYILENDLERPAVFGYSMGGYVALNLARTQPMLLGPIICLGTKLAWTVAGAQQEVKMLQADKILEKVPRFANYLAKLHGEDHWKTLLQQTGDMMLSLGHNPLLSVANVGTITNKILMCLGDQDKMVSREETENFSDAMPNASFSLLPDTPHQIEKVKPSPLAESIRSFLL